MRVSRFLVCALVAAIVLVGCGNPALVDPSEIGDIQRGEDIFVTGGEILGNPCIRCHALEGGTDIDQWGPAMVGISTRAADRVSGLSAVEYLRESILDPSAYVVEGYDDNKMDKFYELLFTDEEIDALVAFMLTQ